MSGSRWQGMKTRHGDGIEALSEEMESNRSATPKSRRHPLTLPADAGDSGENLKHFSHLIIFLAERLRHPRPSAVNANRWADRLPRSRRPGLPHGAGGRVRSEGAGRG